jgi:aromatic-L-amino-acid/L-tryptophan decarboxylase
MAGKHIVAQGLPTRDSLNLATGNVLPWHPAGRMSTTATRPAKDGFESLDPPDWNEFRLASHAALDRMIEDLRSIRTRPVWQAAPKDVLARLNTPLPTTPRGIAEVIGEFDQLIKPYATGNRHPAFMGWVHGAGTPAGMVAEMLAAGVNMNCGGRNHAGIEIEKQITCWMKQAFGFPDRATGLFVTGTSMANFLALTVARNAALGQDVRAKGLAGTPQLCAYASNAVHGCITRAMQMSGIGSDFLRLVPSDETGAMRIDVLQSLIGQDRTRGIKPFLVVGTAGSVDIGAVDPLNRIADVASANRLWFHVDGAFGALAVLSSKLRPLVAGIERADSIGFDFHKWAHVPYDAGYLLVKNGEAHKRAFAAANAYLARAETGLAAGDVWPCDLGPDLSRGFRALKVWFTLQLFGADALARCMEQNCRAAGYLEQRLRASGTFGLAAPVKLNIVCFTVNSNDPGPDNRRLVESLHVSGRAAPSITLLNGKPVIRCAIVNHRTTLADIDHFIDDLADTAHKLAIEI